MSNNQTLTLNDRVAIVTGGSRGIGRAISLHLGSLGAKIVINYSSNSNQADLLVSELNSISSSCGPVAISVRADISNPDQVKSLFDQAELHFSTKPHILVNCAGILDSKYPTIANTTLEDWDNTFNVNTKGNDIVRIYLLYILFLLNAIIIYFFALVVALIICSFVTKGAFLCCREAANRLAHGGGGRMITLSTSLVGALTPGYGAYVASKAAVEAMVKILAKEMKGSGVTVNCVAPGPVATDMFFAGKSNEMVKRIAEACPLGRLGEPDDVAKVVGFLVSDAGEWINGQIVRVNGGFVI